MDQPPPPGTPTRAPPCWSGSGRPPSASAQPGYQRRSPVALAADAARAALADTGADPAPVSAAIDTVAGVRQFEISEPGGAGPAGPLRQLPPLGRRPDRRRTRHGRSSRSSAARRPSTWSTSSRARSRPVDSEVVLIFGSEAISTIEHYAKAEDRPDFTEHAEGSLEDRGYGLRGLVSMQPGRARPDRRARASTRWSRTPAGPGSSRPARSTRRRWARCSRRSPRSRPGIRTPPRRPRAAPAN